MKLRTMLAAVLLISQCGCGHTYFAWNKPLPVDQTEVYQVPPPRFLSWGDDGWSHFRHPNDRSSARQDMREAERHMRTHLPKR